MNGSELAQWILSDFWRILGAVVVIGVTATGFETIVGAIRATPEERMQKGRLKHEAEMAEARREHEVEMAEVRRECEREVADR